MLSPLRNAPLRLLQSQGLVQPLLYVLSTLAVYPTCRARALVESLCPLPLFVCTRCATPRCCWRCRARALMESLCALSTRLPYPCLPCHCRARALMESLYALSISSRRKTPVMVVQEYAARKGYTVRRGGCGRARWGLGEV